MAKKGKSKNKSKSKGGAAAAKKVADTPAALLPEQEVEETVTKSDAEPETVVTDAGAAVTADPTSVLPDTAAKGITAAPLDDSTEEASDAVDSSSPNADEPATEAVKEEVEEPIAVAGTSKLLPSAGCTYWMSGRIVDIIFLLTQPLPCPSAPKTLSLNQRPMKLT
ncbi:uncharacterized protein BP01DRAFT_240899 [Aspergillus saccharolyticus JOP 1030-1]|uniref:Uncharacterized protein n=1 Tax=Aspergillus saccharolyticus JOP 1030-1 TaxID=1450539 RepID=A0A319AK00_9EURO|nr:hypothetical protein BP01DRAFT_240899 [Aspergillus saccharolyticus JOP 1030-1]PYH46942.1 hypothetical protein BP01DRAFT_240899 [Aspergillus saccharolyticus JOP 1030-1]